MARKIFVSYKHGDTDVNSIGSERTARDYVDALRDAFESDEIYKGEGNESLKDFKDETIETHLKDKIYDSSITIVLISPNMKGTEAESDQWIPWEICYSLKEISRGGRVSRTNAVLAVVLPDTYGNYDYYVEDNTCDYCNARSLKTDTLFQILRDNMHNRKRPIFVGTQCSCVKSPSYINSVKWAHFISNKELWLKDAEDRKDCIDDYNIVKEIKDD